MGGWVVRGEGGEGRAEASEQQNSSKEMALKAKGRILLAEAHTWSLLKHLYPPQGILLTFFHSLSGSLTSTNCF